MTRLTERGLHHAWRIIRGHIKPSQRVRIAHRLTHQEAHAVCLVVRARHIPVTATVIHGTTHIYPHRSMTTAEEVDVLRAFVAVTDSVRFHPWGHASSPSSATTRRTWASPRPARRSRAP
jgi:hypothetical protein